MEVYIELGIAITVWSWLCIAKVGQRATLMWYVRTQRGRFSKIQRNCFKLFNKNSYGIYWCI